MPQYPMQTPYQAGIAAGGGPRMRYPQAGLPGSSMPGSPQQNWSSAPPPAAQPPPSRTLPTPSDRARLARQLSASVVVVTTSCATGAGWIGFSDTLVITTYHLVHGARTVSVHLADERGVRSWSCRVVAADPAHDLALLELPEPSGHNPLTLAPVQGDASEPAFLLAPPASVATARMQLTDDAARLGSRPADLDAEPLHPWRVQLGAWDSGEPLVDGQGAVVGMATWCERGDPRSAGVVVAQRYLRALDTGRAGALRVEGAFPDWDAAHPPAGPFLTANVFAAGAQTLALLALPHDRLLLASAERLTTVDAASSTVERVTGFGAWQVMPAAEADSAWITRGGAHSCFERVSLRLGAVVDTVPIAGVPRAFAVAKRHLAYLDLDRNLVLVRVDNHQEYPIDIKFRCLASDPHVDAGPLWCATERFDLCSADPARLVEDQVKVSSAKARLAELNKLGGIDAVRPQMQAESALQDAQAALLADIHVVVANDPNDHADHAGFDGLQAMLFDSANQRLFYQLAELDARHPEAGIEPLTSEFQDPDRPGQPFHGVAGEGIIATSPDGQLAASHSQLYRLRDHRAVALLPPMVRSAAFAEDSRSLFVLCRVGGDNPVGVIDPPAGIDRWWIPAAMAAPPP